MFSVIGKAVVSPMDVIRREDVKRRPEAALTMVLLAAVLGSVAVPIASQLANSSRYGLNINTARMLLAFVASVATWLAVSAMFRLTAIGFHKDIRFGQIASVWGLSYMPNILCLMLYAVVLAAPALWQGSEVASFVFGMLFILCLAWKAIYYYMVVRLVFLASLGEFFKMTALSAVVFAALIFLGSKLGIQVPML